VSGLPVSGMEGTLLPCPFCGAEPFVSSYAGYAIECDNDKCPVRVEVSAVKLSAAVKRWNTRTGSKS
jgi:hypothetical protein